jgi:tetratricopeptide (TPR) repeat protein
MQMQASLAPLERVVAKYRRDVHQLAPGAPNEALTSLEGHLGRLLPPGLREFLAAYNGASLFRGSLRIRSTSDIAPASEDAITVFLFADGPGEARWAFAGDAENGFAFGSWTDERLVPLHETFTGWLTSSLAIIEARVLSQEDIDALRLQLDPNDTWQLINAGVRALQAGRQEEAEQALQQATTRSPNHVLAWQRMGDALAVCDRTKARVAWLRGFRRERLPRHWPGAGGLDPEVFRALARAFNDPEAWERELRRFLADQVVDVVTAEEAEVVVAAAEALARSLEVRGRRMEAREVVGGLVSRCHTFTHAFAPWASVLRLARLEVGLGHHDEAEALIRRVRNDGPDWAQGAALLLLAEVAVTRQEPWAEEILASARVAGLQPEQQVVADLLAIERMIRSDRKGDSTSLLERAARNARRLGSPLLQARVCLIDGDLAREEGDLRRARTAYTRAVGLASDSDLEMRWRAELRLGDVAVKERDLVAAERHWLAAARGYADNGLPVREGWALVRLARLARLRGGRNKELLQAARDRFVAADLAAGVAAVDALGDQPGASLDWHLERSTLHARARYNAQGSRPPWTRADADRPERRLGAHRLAIAACGEDLVGELSHRLDTCAAAVTSGRGRAKDPLVLRYVAACDLLSGHRSYRSAQVLLDHLLQRRVEGVAWRALQGAIARSPNAAIVDGLLRAIENPVELPGPSVVAAAELLGLRREPAAVAALVKLSRPGSRPTLRKAAVSALGRIGNRHVATAIVETLEEPLLAEVSALALLMLGDRRGIDFHGRALLDKRRDLSGHPGEIVGRYGGPEHLLLLQGVAGGMDDRALGALQGLGLLGDPRGVATLLDALHCRDLQVVEVAAGALTILTGHQEDTDTPGWRNRWHAWWGGHHGRFPEGIRHRFGRVFDCKLLIEQMANPDAWTRRTAYDELVISCGATLPFDSDGPWRVQQGHLRAWQSWWTKAHNRYVEGRWYHDGKQIH